jgi:fatty-acyl-CoA synthase
VLAVDPFAAIQAYVVGAPDAEWGEVVVAFVVGSADADELDGHMLQRIARFKRPKRYVFVDDLPKNSYGKVLKRELRNRLAGQSIAVPPQSSRAH